MITVGIREGKRLFIEGVAGVDSHTIFSITKGETKSLSDSILRDNAIRNALLTGALVLKEGKAQFIFKGAKCYISAKKNNRAYILENGKLLVKDLENNTFMKEELSQDFVEKMTSKMLEAY